MEEILTIFQSTGDLKYFALPVSNEEEKRKNMGEMNIVIRLTYQNR
jgi:hypothetical protein